MSSTLLSTSAADKTTTVVGLLMATDALATGMPIVRACVPEQ